MSLTPNFLRALRLVAFAVSVVLPAVMSSAESERFVVSAFGAVADGTTLNTAAIQKAIDAAETAGGGVVEIPAGTFRSGSIFLKRGVGLWLAEGAVLLGSTDIADYPKRETRIEGHFEHSRWTASRSPAATAADGS